jgi:transposase
MLCDLSFLVPCQCLTLVPFCRKACKTAAELESGEIPWKSAQGIEKRLAKRLSGICKKQMTFKPAKTLSDFLSGKDQKFLFTFHRRPGVPPTNNHSEQSIRFLVIFRKIFFGTRSENGLKTHSIIPSLVQTARRQGVHPRKFLQVLLTAGTSSAQAALYNNSS